MSWLLLTLGSALLLGLYDYFKKLALRDNAVLPVLFGSVAAGAAVWLPLVVWAAIAPAALPTGLQQVAELDVRGHLLLFGKAALVGASWLLGYYGIKALPLSIASPIRATGPLWTIAFAVLVFGEAPSAKQWLGVAIVLLSFFGFTVVGRREGIHFHRHTGVFFMIGATLLGAASSLFDKYLLQSARLSPYQVQAWFTIYLALMLVPALACWARMKDRQPWHWHWAIPVIGITLLAADILYFTAIAQPGALISLISPVRRTSVVVSFLLGIVLFRERQVGLKAICVAGIIGGVILLA